MLTTDIYGAVPGLTTARETYEAAFRFGQFGVGIIAGAIIDGATRDAGSTPTTELRPGLLLGQESSGAGVGQWKDYLATRTDGSGIAAGILMTGIRITDFDNNNQQRFYGICVGGPIQGSKILGLDGQARQQMRNHFMFDDDYAGRYTYPWKQQISKATAYQILAGDQGTLFDNTGAGGSVTFTLPAIKNGYSFGFLVVADQPLLVTSTEGTNIIAPNNVSASTVSFATGGDQIGGTFRIYSNPAGTKWIVEKPCSNAMTIA